MVLQEILILTTMNKKNIVVIGGGTGTSRVLSALKNSKHKLTAIISMTDDGGSTGRLRRELNVLPAGDVRQCLIALRKTRSAISSELMNYRFSDGSLKGHNFGNLLISALEKTTGDFETAIQKTAQLLHVKGEVIPVTLSDVTLIARLQDGSIIRGQNSIHNHNLRNLHALMLEPKAKPNPKALQSIMSADFIVIGPGDLYSSLIPPLLIKEIPQTIARSRAKRIFICNLTTKAGHTDNFSVADYTKTIEQYLGEQFDFILYNNKEIPPDILSQYGRRGEKFVHYQMSLLSPQRFLGGHFLNTIIPSRKSNDPIERSLIHHDLRQLKKAIYKVMEGHKS